jgi:hypothetical protein
VLPVAKPSDSDFYQSVQPHLLLGEQVKHFGYGVEQPVLWLTVLLYVVLLGVPGYFVVGLLTRHYVLALTDARLLVVRVKGGLFEISFEPTEVKAYLFEELAALPIEAAVGSKTVRLQIGDPLAKPLIVRFHRAASPGNRTNTVAIATALGTLKASGIDAMRALLPEGAPKSRHSKAPPKP